MVDYNPADSTHTVLVNIGMGAEEACEPLPLVEYPDAYQVCFCVTLLCGCDVTLWL